MSRLISLTAIAAVILCGSASPHDPDGRIRTLTKLIAKRPADAQLLVRRGELHRQVGHLGHAMRDFDRAQKLAPELSDVHFARAMALLDSRKHTAALGSIDRYLTKRPSHGYAVLMRARLLMRVGRRDASARAYDRAIRLLPKLVPAHFIEQAMAHAAGGDAGIRRAIRCVRQGIETLGPIVSLTSYGKKLGMDLGDISPLTRSPDPTIASAPPTGALPPTTSIGEAVIVPFSSVWKYKDDGSDQGTAWRSTTFNDTAWNSGPAELGYGDGDEWTTVGFGNNAQQKHITTYFRQAFTMPIGVAVARARLLLIRDDGAVLYLNGREIARDNMPAGKITHTTLASAEIHHGLEADVHSIPLDHTYLKPGRNVLAVEIHQYTATSPDISLSLELRVSDGITTVDRGPFLQQGGPTSAIIRWRTDYPTESVAFLGSAPNLLKAYVQNNFRAREHTALLAGLKPNTTYYYGIGNKNGILASGSDYRFTTAPTPGTNKKTRIWAIGDSGTANADAAAVRNAYLKHTGSTPTDVWLMLGDNAYLFGTDPEYQRAVFDMYPGLLRSTFLWPTIGNHDALSSYAPLQIGPYFDIFTLPTQGEIGGVASGTEDYYSFDHGDIHFVCLNSADSYRSSAGAMMTWLRADLAATKAKWVIAYWHHPPYSKGSHDSDNPFEVEMIEMRQNALPFLEAAGVDLVLTGHSHSYERSFLLDGHYGYSSSLKKGMLVDQGNGRPGSHGAYTKPTLRGGSNEGAVYVVAGCAGQATGGTLDHKAMVVSLNNLGSMVIDVDGDKLEAKFLTSTGATQDSFTILKGVTRTLTRDAATISLTTGGTQSLAIEAGASHAGRFYRLAGSLGTKPGFQINNVHVPLNPDDWFRVSVVHANSSIFQGTLGTLDFNGSARARISLPPTKSPAGIGLVFHHAYIVYDASGVRMASNPVSLTLVK